MQNTCRRAVRPDGNVVAKDLLGLTFAVTGSTWQGLGRIGGSGLALRPEFSGFDGRQRLVGELDAARRRMAAVNIRPRGQPTGVSEATASNQLDRTCLEAVAMTREEYFNLPWDRKRLLVISHPDLW